MARRPGAGSAGARAETVRAGRAPRHYRRYSHRPCRHAPKDLPGRTGAGGERARPKGRRITTACAPPWGGKRPAAHLLRIHALAGAPAGTVRAGRVIEPGSGRGRRGSWNGHVRSRRVRAVRHHVKLRRRRIACGVFLRRGWPRAYFIFLDQRSLSVTIR